MALFKASLRMAHDVTWSKRLKWSNTFYVQAESAANAAALIATGWTQHLRYAARTTVFAYEVYATSVTPGDNLYHVQAITPGQVRGLVVPPEGEQYWYETCLSVTIPVAGSRPSRKFWRPGLYEGDITNSTSMGAALAMAVMDNWNNFIDEYSPLLCDPDGEPWAPGVTMRITRRAFGRTAALNLPVSPPVG